MNKKLKAVTGGQSLRELTTLIGTAAWTRAMIPEGGSPVKRACMPKKYVLKIGLNTTWLITTLVVMDTHLEAKLKFLPRKRNLFSWSVTN